MFSRICQVRLIKMPDKNNPKLLEMDNCPGKFYLDGFLPHEFVRITNVITKHGGIVMSPDDETIVLSKQSNPRGGMNEPRFHVQWLHDCIRNNELLDIGKYLVPKVQASPQRSTLAEATTTLQTKTNDEKTSKTFDEKRQVYKQPEGTKDGRLKAVEHVEKLTKLNRSVSNKRRASSSKSADDSIDDTEKDTSIDDEEKPLSTRRQDKSAKKRSHSVLNGQLDESIALPKKRKSSSLKKQERGSLSSTKKNLNVDRSECLTVEESIECVISNEANNTSLEESTEISSKNLSLPEEEMDSSKSWQDAGSSDGEVKKTGNHEDSLDKDKSKTPKRGRYSKEETQKMMKYLAENNLLSMTNKSQVWQELAATEMFRQRGRSAASLRKHYRRIITQHGDEYLADPNVTEGEKKDRKKLKNILNYFYINVDEQDDSSKTDDEEEEGNDNDGHDPHDNVEDQ